MRLWFPLAAAAFAASPLAAQPFVDAQISLPGVSRGAVAWADYDNDGRGDLAVAGQADGARITHVYRGTASGLALAATLTGVSSASLAWADYDGDGDADLVVAGFTGAAARTVLYRNDGGTFVDSGVALAQVFDGEVAWGDLDADGRPDLAVLGQGDAEPLGRVYRNTGGGTFAAGLPLPALGSATLAWGDANGDGRGDVLVSGLSGGQPATRLLVSSGTGLAVVPTGLPDVAGGALAWADFNGDGRLDLALAGFDGSTGIARVYRNTPSGFADTGAVLPGVSGAALAWGDLDGDGRPDLALAGQGSTERVARVYRNTASGFAEIRAELPGVSGAALAWAFVDEDGRLDLTLAGETSSGRITRVYLNPPPVFEDLGAGLPGLSEPSLAWGDADGDGRLDLALTGRSGPFFVPTTRLFRNARPGFPEGGSGLSDLVGGPPTWTDFDGDGRLDLALFGTGQGSTSVRLYRNTGGSTFQAAFAIPGLSDGRTAWADFDGDGRLDLAFAGQSSAGRTVRVYRNTGAGFEDVGAGLAGASDGTLAWGDADGDGRPDLVVAGLDDRNVPATRLYRNTPSGFVEVSTPFPGVSGAALAWADYDGDRRLDLALAGRLSDGTTRVARVYRNTLGGFVDVGAGLPGVSEAALAWGDVDGDGRPDLVLAGMLSDGTLVTRLYRYAGAGGFTEIPAGLPGVRDGTLAWGDATGDGRTDLALAGFDGSAGIARVYRNVSGGDFFTPAVPTVTSVATSAGAVTVAWTGPLRLTYNVLVADGTGAALLPPLALAAGTAAPPPPGVPDGVRLVPAPGNAGLARSYTLRRSGLDVRGTQLTVGVQAVAPTYEASPFARRAVAAQGDDGVDALVLAGAEGWRMLAPPRAGMTYAELLGPLWTQGLPGSDAPGAPDCTVFTFDETVRIDTNGDGAVTVRDGWRCLADLADPAPPGRGVMVYVYADDDGDGTVEPGEGFPKTLPLPADRRLFSPSAAAEASYTASPASSHANRGWTLTGAPLSFGLDWDLATRSGALDATVYVYDPGFLGGEYRAHTAGQAGDLPDGVIPPGQGFFVKANGPDARWSAPAGSVPAADPPLLGALAAPAEARRAAVGETPGVPGPPPPQATGVVAGGSAPERVALALDAVRPNPAAGRAHATLALPEAGAVRAAVVDVLGREVALVAAGALSAGRHALAVETAALAPGLYVLRAETSAGVVARRFTVAR